jgi:hypothetical protein
MMRTGASQEALKTMTYSDSLTDCLSVQGSNVLKN